MILSLNWDYKFNACTKKQLLSNLLRNNFLMTKVSMSNSSNVI